MAKKQVVENISEPEFMGKVKRIAKYAGKETVVAALKLYYALRDSDTPIWVKTVICGALAYFIMPLDAVPDFLPGGYIDDLGTMLAALAGLKSSIKPSHTEKAEQVAEKWFPSTTKNNSDRKDVAK